VWDCHFDSQTNLVEVYINRLRQKLDQNRSAKLIHTVRGVGYRLGVPE
jgi:DNA-binding response OmpR family regulator